jgi:hypothetical protein
MATTNEFNYGLQVSVNYINPIGFDPTQPVGTVNPTNVNYDYTTAGAPLTLPQQLQNLANLLYDPRPPVFVVTNTLAAKSNDFRFFLNLNRNTNFDGTPRFDPTGFLPATNDLNQPTGFMDFFVGDPQWIGALRYPEFAHAANNPFIYRYAYLVVPAGQTLDLNTIHNYAKKTLVPGENNVPWPDGFLRDQGVLSSEINLAAFLVDLNTNMWPLSPPPRGAPPFDFPAYSYNTDPNVASTGAAADDAASLLRYRYATNLYSLANVKSLFANGAAAFGPAPVDCYSEGPLMTGASWPPPGYAGANPNLTRVSGNYPWPGADNPNRFYTSQDLFDRSKIGVPSGGKVTPFSFVDRLLIAGARTNSYDRYTFYRLLSQLGTDSDPEPGGKMNLNYCNLDNNGYFVRGMETNFIPWTPVQFFTNAAIRLLANAGYTVGNLNSTSNILVLGSNIVNGAYLPTTNLHILIWPTNYYTPSVHRLLQLAANIYDATTNRTFGVATATNGFPSVFRPVFSTVPVKQGAGQIAISGYAEVTDTASVLTPPGGWVDLNAATGPKSLTPNSMVYGLPLIIGAKKGLPNFNEFAMTTTFTITRKLEFLRKNGLNNGPIVQTNQMYVLTISNVCGLDAWNSYATPYPRPLSLWVLGKPGDRDINAFLTDSNMARSWLYSTNFAPITTNIPAYSWLGFAHWNDSPNSFITPLRTNFLTLPNSQYLLQTGPPYFLPVSGSGSGPGYTFENPSGFQTPDWWLAFTNRLRFAIVDTSVTPNRFVDFVNLEFCGPPMHITSIMEGGLCSGPSWSFSAVNSSTKAGTPFQGPSPQWCTNTVSGGASYGVLNQIFVNQGVGVGAGNYWAAAPTNQYALGFFLAQFLPAYSGGAYTLTNTFYASYVPSFTTNLYTSWQVNDPLVHYTIWDLTNSFTAASDPMVQFDDGKPNQNYRPWNADVGKGQFAAEPSAGLTYKDPVALGLNALEQVGRSDYWDFPTNKFPNPGWLGRVHRGTPWQTVYLKSSPTDLGTWMNRTGNGLVVTNFGQFSTNILLPNSAIYYPLPAPPVSTFSNGVAVYDAYFTLPATDWHVLDLFTSALSDSATRGQLSINQTNLAAWSAVLSGVIAFTNTVDANGNPTNYPLVIPPAGCDPSNTTPVMQIVNGINAMRTNFPNQEFHTLGDFLATPALTVASPFLNPGAPLNDEAYERIPQQILGLLKCDHTPRFVIYAFGQALKPAPNSIYTGNILGGGSFAGLCTNYQIMAEAATRTVIRFEGVQPGVAGAPPAITSLHPVIESFTVLPPTD